MINRPLLNLINDDRMVVALISESKLQPVESRVDKGPLRTIPVLNSTVCRIVRCPVISARFISKSGRQVGQAGLLLVESKKNRYYKNINHVSHSCKSQVLSY